MMLGNIFSRWPDYTPVKMYYKGWAENQMNPYLKSKHLKEYNFEWNKSLTGVSMNWNAEINSRGVK